MMDKAIEERVTNGRMVFSNIIIKSIETYECEVWSLKKRTKEMLRSTEMNFWRRAESNHKVYQRTHKKKYGYRHAIVDNVKITFKVWENIGYSKRNWGGGNKF